MLDQFGNQRSCLSLQQTKEEREAKTEKVYLGNVTSCMDERSFP